MSLNVLIAAPADDKFFIDLMASCLFAKRHHPELTTDIIVPAANVPGWWNFSAPWMRIFNDTTQVREAYDLIIQLHPDPAMAESLALVSTEHRSGVISHEGIMVNGRWAQAFLAQLGSRRFGPFAAFDLFNHIILGRTAPFVATPPAPQHGDWIVDVESMPANRRSWGEDLLSQVNFAHPNHARLEVVHPLNPEKISAYIGCDTVLASWLAFHQVPVVLLHENEFEPRMLLAGAQCWYQRLTPQLTAGQVMSLLRSQPTPVDAIRYTDEYLGGLAAIPDDRPATVAQIFDNLHYVVFNYLNDLREVDLPIPATSASACMHLKGTIAVLAKLVHLNQFGMRFLQEFLAKVETGTVADKDVQEISQKVKEIDELTERTLTAYPEFDIYRMSLRFAKASAQGENIVEIAKSLILLLHESNQTLQVYSELIDTIIKRHVRPQDNANA
jgi:hypothetical protein